MLVLLVRDTTGMPLLTLMCENCNKCKAGSDLSVFWPNFVMTRHMTENYDWHYRGYLYPLGTSQPTSDTSHNLTSTPIHHQQFWTIKLTIDTLPSAMANEWHLSMSMSKTKVSATCVIRGISKTKSPNDAMMRKHLDNIGLMVNHWVSY